MEQHPIPQQISSYQFKLVGDMTLKQFFQLAGGVIVGLVFYSTPLHPLIKWPFIFVSVLLGVALAFLPFEERPLEKWIVAFFRSIYSPTLYSWKKTDKPPVFFTEDAQVPAVQNVPTSQIKTSSSQLEESEKNFLNKITSLWSVSNSTPVSNQPAPSQPTQTIQPTAPAQNNLQNDQTIPATETSLKSESVQTVANKPIDVPQQIPTIINKSAPKLVVEEKKTSVDEFTPKASGLDAIKLEEKEITSSTVEFSVDAAPPMPPTTINTVVGQVIDQDRKIVEGAIMEIKDINGRPVRALKSNKAGHFMIVTSLSNGKYEILTEKDGYNFEPVSFETKGEIIPPIAIKGTKI